MQPLQCPITLPMYPPLASLSPLFPLHFFTIFQPPSCPSVIQTTLEAGPVAARAPQGAFDAEERHGAGADRVPRFRNYPAQTPESQAPHRAGAGGGRAGRIVASSRARARQISDRARAQPPFLPICYTRGGVSTCPRLARRVPAL